MPDGDRQDARRESARRASAIPTARTSSAASTIRSRRDSHLVILYGNLAPDGARREDQRQGRASGSPARRIVFDREEAALEAILRGRVKKGHVVVIRYEGPARRPGMREMLSPTSAIMGRGLGQGRRAHHRRPLQRRHARLRRRPHHAGGVRRRPDRAREERRPDHDRRARADSSRSTCPRRTEDQRATEAVEAPKPRYTRGVLAKYARQVSSASRGAVTDGD